MNDNELRLLKDARKKLGEVILNLQNNPENVFVEDTLEDLLFIDDLLDMYD